MKKFLTLTLLCFLSVMAWGASSGTVGNYAYSFNDDYTATISGFGYGVSGITEMEIPGTVMYSGDEYTVTKISHDMCNAPNYYSAILTEVIIPKSIVEIGYRAFNGQTSLTTIYCYAEEVPELTSSNGTENVFNNVTATVYVPAASVSAYAEAWGEKYSGLSFVALDGDTGDGGDHDGDYLTPEIMGFDLASSSKQTIESFIGPSGTDYGAICYVGVLNESTGVDFTGDFNISASGDYIRNNSSVGYLRKVIIEPDENYTGSYSLSVRVANEPYTGSSHSAFSSYGVEVAQIPGKDGGSVELSDDYQYFAVSHVNSYDTATRFKAIELIWETEGGGDTGGSSNHEYSINPEEGVQSSLQKFILTSYEGFVSDENGYSDYQGTVYLYKDGGSDPYASTSNIDSGWDESINDIGDIWLSFEFANEITESGEYEFVIPAGLFYWLDGEDIGSPNEEMRFSYTVDGSGDTGGSDAPYTVEPEEDVVQQSLSYVKFIAQGAICYSEEIEASEVKVYKDEVEVASGASVQDDYTSGTWDDAVNIYFDTELVEAGDYKVVVPAGFMNLGSWTVYNDVITLNYTVDGSLDTGGTGSGSHEGDYLTPEIMGFDLASSSKQTIESFIGPSGTDYGAVCYAGVLNESTGVDFTGDFNISAGGDYIRNNSSVGYLRELIIEGDENYTSGYSLSVRVANEPYTGSSHSAFSSYGEEVAQISAKDGGSVVLSDNYQYFAVSHVNSYDTATRFKAIELIWETEGGGNTGGSGTFSCTIDPDPETGSVDDLSQITFSNEYGIYYNEEGENGYDDDPIVIYDSEDNPVSYIDNITPILSSDEEAEVGQVVTFEPIVTEAGDYIVVVPPSFFYSIDENGYKGYNDELKLSYTFEGASQETGGVPEGYVLDPADQAEVPTLSEIIISLESDNITCGSNFATVVVKNEEGQDVTTITLDDETDYGKVICTLDNGGISTAGTYTITFPEGVLLDWRTIDPNPEFTVTYYVTGETSTGGDHEGDYLTPEIMGFDLASSSKQTIESFIGPSGTDYGAVCYAGVLNESTGVDFTGDFNISAGGDYIRNNSSVGYLRELIIEGDENYTSGYSLSVRVANEPYTGSSHSAFSSYGEEVAQISAKDGGSVVLSDNYQYFAVSHVNSYDTATRFKAIELIWETEGSGDTGSGVPEGYTVEPAEGEVESLTEIIFSCTDGSSLSDYGISYTQSLQEQFTVVDESGDVVATYGRLDEIEISDGIYKMGIVLSASVTDAGAYTVNVPAGAFLSWSDFEPNPAFTIHYTVTGNTGGSGYELVVDPESGETLESLSEFSITCAEGLGLNNMDDPLYVKKDGEVVAHAWGDTPIMDGVSYIGYNFVICDPSTEADLTLTDEGEYTIEVPDEYFVFDDESLSEGFTITYYIGETSNIPAGYILDPADGEYVETLSQIVLSLESGENLTLNLAANVGTVISKTGQQVATLSWDDSTISGSVIAILSEEVSDIGTYYVTFPASTFYDWGEYEANPEFTATYYVTGSSDTGGITHHENDYLTPEIMGFDLASSSKQTIESFIGPSGTEYGAYCYVGVLNEGTGIDYTGDFNISGAGDYIRNNESVGYLRQLIIEPDENYTSDYVLPVRVAHVPYTGSSYSAFSEYGELVAEIVVKEGGSVELPDDDYEYFAVGTANNWSEAKRFKSIELVWEVEGAAVPQVTFDPESGSSHSELSEFTVICEEGLGFNEKNAISITCDGEELDIYVNAWEIEDGIKTTMDFSTDEWGEYPTSLTEAGTYVITIPAGFFILGDDKVESKKLSVTYIIEGSEVVEPTGSYSYVVDPEEGQVESLSVIELTSDDEEVDGFLGNYEYALYTQEALVYSMYERGDPITTATLASGGELDDYDSSIIITLKDEITDPGSYRVVIPEGSFYWIVNDEPILNDEIDLSYYIEAPQGEYSYDPADESTLTSLSEFSVYYEDGGIVCSRNYVGYITVYDEYGNYITNDADCVTTYPEDEPYGDGLYCTITLNTEITAEGKYTITIPEGYFIVGDNYLNSKELVITYTVSVPTGINGISINDENVEGIYSVGGQKLNKTQKGVNIIRYNDGSTKKVLISK